MQPVPCWERMRVPSDINPNIKVYKWVKTSKIPHYSDDELDADEPLAPLPDEPEIVEGDEDMEQDEAAAPAPATTELQVPAEPEVQDEDTSKGPSPQPQLSIPTEDNGQDPGEPAGGLQLEDSLKPVDVNMDDLEGQGDADDVVLGADLSGLGPDGLPLEGAHDLAQLDPGDAMGGPREMDESGDPFASVS